MLVRRRREPPHQRVRPRAGCEPRRSATRERRTASSARRPRGRAVECAPPALRPRRGGNVAPRYGNESTQHVNANGWVVEARISDETESAQDSVSLRRPLRVIRSDLRQVGDDRALGRARATKARDGVSLTASWAAARAQQNREEGLRGWKRRARDPRATRRAGSRGAPVARAHCRIPFRARCNGRDAARVGGWARRSRRCRVRHCSAMFG